MISFIHLWLYFAGIKIVCSFLKLSCILYMVHASQKGGGISILINFFLNIFIIVPLCKRKFCDDNIILVLNFSFLIIYIIVPLCKRKFCDGHIILVSVVAVYVSAQRLVYKVGFLTNISIRGVIITFFWPMMHQK